MVSTFLNGNYQTSIFPFLSQRKLNQILPLLYQLLTFLSISQLKEKNPMPPSAWFPMLQSIISLPNLILNVFILLLCGSSQIPFKSHFPATSMSDVF